MYKIIGADGKEYGPITLEQLKQWIAEGRLNLQSKVLPEGTLEWKTVAEVPELAVAVPPPASPVAGYAAIPGAANAVDQVSGPAIGLIVVACLSLAVALLNLILNLTMTSLFPMPADGPSPEIMKFAQGIGGIIGAGVAFAIYGTMLFGAIKMKKLQSYGLAMTAAILGLLPCSICCLAGLPIGIWALVALNKPGVKSAFN